MVSESSMKFGSPWVGGFGELLPIGGGMVIVGKMSSEVG